MLSVVARTPHRLSSFFAQRSPGFDAACIALLGAIIYLPRLGSYPLWDPWEPHYAQVAWEMGERDTWVNPFYRGVDNWWSKPILMLWLLRASFALLWDPVASFANHELAARLPFALLAILGGVLQYDWVRRLFGRALGALATLALLTAPQYLLIGRQAMADMPFVMPYMLSLGYLMVGLFGPERVATSQHKPIAWLQRSWPLVLFWVLQGLAVLAKGFVPPVLAVMILLGYAISTFRWQDYRHLLAGKELWLYVATRGLLALVTLAGAVRSITLVPDHLPRDQQNLYRVLIAAPALLGVVLGVFHDFPPSRHALRLLRRIGAHWGLAVFFLVAAPWYTYMTLTHGWKYWNEFIFYHHLGRAAGTIDKPGGTFDYYVRQLGFAAFPWSAFLLGAVWQFASRASPLRSIADRRNLFVLLATLLPYLFFTLSGTKFAHYIFPVVPFACVMLAATLLWMMERLPQAVALFEPGPPLGPSVPANPADETPWWQRPGSKGDLLTFAALALVAFGILAHDLVIDFRYFTRLFIYYYNRATPFTYQPYILLQLLFAPIGVVIGTLLLTRAVKGVQIVLLGVGALVVACYISWVMMPSMESTYTYKPVYEAYVAMAKPGDMVGQFNNWQQPERSVLFLFQNRAEHLKTDKQTTAFLSGPGRKFIIVDKNRLSDLRRLAKKKGVKLFVVFDDHPYARLVSTEPDPNTQRRIQNAIVSALPESAKPLDVNFDDKIKLVGYEVPAEPLKPGSSFEVTLYFQALNEMDRDWQIFAHGDGPRGSQNRLRADHYPVDNAYTTNEWQEGEIIRDTFTLELPPSYPYNQFTLWVGFYIDEERLPIKSGASDGDNRARGPVLKVQR